MKDAEGYNMPPPRSDPISLAQEEADKMQGSVNLANDPRLTSNRSGESSSAQQFKLDIRNAPVAENNPEAHAAMANMAETLRAVGSGSLAFHVLLLTSQ